MVDVLFYMVNRTKQKKRLCRLIADEQSAVSPELNNPVASGVFLCQLFAERKHTSSSSKIPEDGENELEFSDFGN